MAFTTQAASIGGGTKNLIVATDPNGNLAAAHVTVNSAGAEVGTSGNPIAVSFAAAQPVTGTFFPSSQPVSLAALPALTSSAAVIGAVMQSGVWNTTISGSVAVTGAFYQATQAISAAILPLPAGAATDAALGAKLDAAVAAINASAAAPLPAGANVIGALLQPANVATGQVTVGTSATLIVAARAGRWSVSITQEGTTLVRLGGSGVTLTSGAVLPGTQYSDRSLDGGAAIYGIVAAGSAPVSFVEVY